MLSLRGMDDSDLPLVARWLRFPHVAKWFLVGSSVARELDDLRRSISGEQDVHALVVADGEVPIGWCQWYRCVVDPLWAADVGAAPEDVGIDYAIGCPDHIGRGLGSELVEVLIDRVRAAHPGCALTADPDARNLASRRVLEKNDFELVTVTVVPSEASLDPVAIYRLPAVR